MKFTPEIIAALQVLKDNAENDFERHRIDVLENDLTNPPRVEVIDEKYQRFNGVNFRKRKGGHYFTPMYSIYRAVWQYYYGEVPPKTIIHHIDENKDNNNIENLTPMFPADHVKYHHGKNFDNRLNVPFICSVCGKVYRGRFVGQKKFVCPECRKNSPQKIYQKICAWCGKEFTTTGKKTECCSQSCAGHLTYYRRTGETGELKERVCIVCGKKFYVSRSHKSKGQKDRITCSAECLSKYRSLIHKPKTVIIKKCEICGKSFEVKNDHPETRTCSPECAKKLAFPNAEHITTKCEFCGKQIEHLKSDKRRFCSRDCLNKWLSLSRTKHKKIVRRCACCGKKFEVSPDNRKNYCSSECKENLKSQGLLIKIPKKI